MTLEVIQSYSDGSEAAWIDEPVPGSTAEPEHPAPTIALAAPQGEPAAATPATAPSPANPPASPGSAGSAAAGASTGTVVGAYVVGALGLLAGLAALASGLGARRRAQPAAPVTEEAAEGVRTGVE